VAKKSSRGKGTRTKSGGKGAVNRKTFLMEVEVSTKTTAIAPLYACAMKVKRVTSKPGK
jgi:hypothetical protein